MTNRIYILALIVVICVSCSNAQPIQTSVPTLTLIPSQSIPTQSPTYPLTPELQAPTPTLNPALAEVLTSTPNFRKIPTHTPSSPQACPTKNINVKPVFPQNILEAPRDFSYPQAILEYLNIGGAVHPLQNYLGLSTKQFAEKDLTGDRVPELIISIGGLDIFMCHAGKYAHILHVDSESGPFAPTIIAVGDMNLDGTPELVLQDEVFSASSRDYRIYEWNGNEFQSLVWAQEDLTAWLSTPKARSLTWYNSSPFPEQAIEGIESDEIIKDVDGNGTQEFIVRNHILPVRIRGYSPWRATTDIYKWNGILFLWDQIDIEPPVYRFQAVQDADRLSLLGEYKDALDLYQAVISSNNLYAWSLKNYQEQIEAEGQGTPTPTPIPLIQEEYENLAAYAHYRILLSNIVEGDLDSAQMAYKTLQEKFQGKTGHLYVEMATGFWQNYQSSKSLSEACLTAIKYAEEHKDDIFIYLGNTEYDSYSHGIQSHQYIPLDMCPFE